MTLIHMHGNVYFICMNKLFDEKIPTHPDAYWNMLIICAWNAFIDADFYGHCLLSLCLAIARFILVLLLNA